MTAADILALFPSTFLNFLIAFGLGAVFWVAGLVIVSLATPHAELALLRAGNLPTAVAFGGKALGMVLPIAEVGPLLYQAHCPLPVFDSGRGPVHAAVSVWMVGGEPAGLSFRESRGPVTGADARFVPHILRG